MSDHAVFVVAAGGYRTGSTLQYNLIGMYVEQLGVGQRLGLVEPDEVDTMVAEFGSRLGFVGVAKCHHVVAGYRPFVNPTRWVDLVTDGRAIPITTVRDEPEQRRSMMRKFDIAAADLDTNVHWLENAANAHRWRELRAFEQRYETLTEEPLLALRQLCARLELRWHASAAADAVAGSGADVMTGQMGELAAGSYDPVTLVHWDHISPATARDFRRRPVVGS